MPLLHRFPDPETAAEAAALGLTTRVGDAVARNGRATVALAGGRTPELLYASIVQADAAAKAAGAPRAPWASVDWFFSDERMVSPDDERSNFRLARRALFEPLGIAHARVRRLRGDAKDAEAEASRAESELLDAAPEGGLDVVLLGLGKDGHVASLFPGAPTLGVANRLIVTAAPGMEPLVPRLTFTLEALRRARDVVVLATGVEKAAVLRRILVDKDEALPATRVAPKSRRIAWFVDAAAASALGTT